jgi:hypothetical protein
MSNLSPSRKSRYVDLPAGMTPLDLSIDEVSALRRESRWTVHQKIRDGRYKSYKDGRLTKVVLSSVMEDRERSIAIAATGAKRRVGRPPKPRPAEASPAPVEA